MINKLTNVQIKNICKRYQKGKSSSFLSKKFNIHKNTVFYHLRKNNVSVRISPIGQRVRTLNESAFDQITEESAYWIGFLMADGSIGDTKKNKQKSLLLALNNKDISHLYKIKKFLKSEHKIGNKKVRNKYNCSQIQISSDKLCNKLISYGVTPRKTFTAKVCKELENNRHFWRGMIDGDGSLFFVLNKYPSIQLTGSKEIILQCIKYITNISGFILTPLRDRTSYKMKTSGQKTVILIKHFYKNSNIYLDRKYKKAMEIIEREK